MRRFVAVAALVPFLFVFSACSKSASSPKPNTESKDFVQKKQAVTETATGDNTFGAIDIGRSDSQSNAVSVSPGSTINITGAVFVANNGPNYAVSRTSSGDYELSQGFGNANTRDVATGAVRAGPGEWSVDSNEAYFANADSDSGDSSADQSVVLDDFQQINKNATVGSLGDTAGVAGFKAGDSFVGISVNSSTAPAKVTTQASQDAPQYLRDTSEAISIGMTSAEVSAFQKLGSKTEGDLTSSVTLDDFTNVDNAKAGVSGLTHSLSGAAGNGSPQFQEFYARKVRDWCSTNSPNPNFSPSQDCLAASDPGFLQAPDAISFSGLQALGNQDGVTYSMDAGSDSGQFSFRGDTGPYFVEGALATNVSSDSASAFADVGAVGAALSQTVAVTEAVYNDNTSLAEAFYQAAADWGQENPTQDTLNKTTGTLQASLNDGVTFGTAPNEIFGRSGSRATFEASGTIAQGQSEAQLAHAIYDRNSPAKAVTNRLVTTESGTVQSGVETTLNGDNSRTLQDESYFSRTPSGTEGTISRQMSNADATGTLDVATSVNPNSSELNLESTWSSSNHSRNVSVALSASPGTDDSVDIVTASIRYSQSDLNTDKQVVTSYRSNYNDVAYNGESGLTAIAADGANKIIDGTTHGDTEVATLGTSNSSSVAFATFNDGSTATTDSEAMGLVVGNKSPNHVYRRNSDGDFVDTGLELGDNETQHIETGLINNDKCPDIVAFNADDDYIYYHDCNGSLGYSERVSFGAGDTHGGDLVDINEDGPVDIVTARHGQNQVHLTNFGPVAMCKNVSKPAGPDCEQPASVDDGSYDQDANKETINHRPADDSYTPDGAISETAQEPSGPYSGAGSRQVSLTVTDNDGGTATCQAEVELRDETAPTISVESSEVEIWPPNHKCRSYNVLDKCGIDISDNCASGSDVTTQIVSVTSDEPFEVRRGGDGNHQGDIEITGDETVKLRAERQGGSNGRYYTVKFEATDASGNSSTGTCNFVVPHDQNPSTASIDDGAAETCSAGGDCTCPAAPTATSSKNKGSSGRGGP